MLLELWGSRRFWRREGIRLGNPRNGFAFRRAGRLCNSFWLGLKKKKQRNHCASFKGGSEKTNMSSQADLACGAHGEKPRILKWPHANSSSTAGCSGTLRKCLFFLFLRCAFQVNLFKGKPEGIPPLQLPLLPKSANSELARGCLWTMTGIQRCSLLQRDTRYQLVPSTVIHIYIYMYIYIYIQYICSLKAIWEMERTP